MTALLLGLAGLGAGAFGSLLGLGGGVLLVPVLTLVFGYPIVVAAGASLVAVIATSASAASHYVRTGQADVRLGLVLETATVVGALVGGLLAGFLPERVLAFGFAALLAYVAVILARRAMDGRADGDATEGDEDEGHRPLPRRLIVPAFASAGGAGVISSLLGIGGGIVKVPLVHLLLGRSMRVSVATSNFVIGVTAAAGAFPYLARGDVDPAVAGPVVVGVAAGAFLGARLGGRINARLLAIVFILVLLYTAAQMALRGMSG
ncbi:MAG: sulfite exporter TauE/SafE family protein [Chloroflexota bacterium]